MAKCATTPWGSWQYWSTRLGTNPGQAPTRQTMLHAPQREGFRVKGAALPDRVTRFGEEHGRGRETSGVSGINDCREHFQRHQLPCGAEKLVAIPQGGPGVFCHQQTLDVDAFGGRADVAQKRTNNLIRVLPGAVVCGVELEGRAYVRVVVLRLDEALGSRECHAQLIADLDTERDPIAALKTQPLLVGPDQRSPNDWTRRPPCPGSPRGARSGAVADEAAAGERHGAAPPGVEAAACADSKTWSPEAEWGITRPSGEELHVADTVPHTAFAGERTWGPRSVVGNCKLVPAEHPSGAGAWVSRTGGTEAGSPCIPGLGEAPPTRSRGPQRVEVG
ncbi:hypothetical protein B0H17DRAFT_1129261 [Mycena rosella]|uniref:Uncharacterized protein n=1 Tax=Mycena rosella TaxID=1033263 RepID=A0AAD7DUW6_MYCRO|nr:hypothetical protein B0H17DRAFT_1129261 [Mycena rosella]